MAKPYSEELVAGVQPYDLKLRKLVFNLGNAYVRLVARDRRKVMRLLEQFAFGKNRTASYWDRWSKDDMKCCYLQLQPISQRMANDLRRWASVLLKAGRNNKLALKCLMDELVVRKWIEEP
jgi:hypothetical protein